VRHAKRKVSRTQVLGHDLFIGVVHRRVFWRPKLPKRDFHFAREGNAARAHDSHLVPKCRLGVFVGSGSRLDATDAPGGQLAQKGWVLKKSPDLSPEGRASSIVAVQVHVLRVPDAAKEKPEVDARRESGSSS